MLMLLFLIFFQAAPKIALVPYLSFGLALGLFSKLFVVFFNGVFPDCYWNDLYGMNAIPKETCII